MLLRTGRLAIFAALLAYAVPGTASDFLPDTTTGSQWSGFYIGGQLGGAWSDTNWGLPNRNWFNQVGPILVFRDFDMDSSGVLGGGQIGYNYQSGALVFGLEGSLAGADLEGERPGRILFPAIIHYSENYSWLTTVTGRLGFASGRWLAYAKGGWAGADVELTLYDRGVRGFPVRANASRWADGYTIGGGAEYALGGGFSLGAEYAFIALDTGRFTVSCATCPIRVGGGVPVADGDIEIQSVTARVNYRFGR